MTVPEGRSTGSPAAQDVRAAQSMFGMLITSSPVATPSVSRPASPALKQCIILPASQVSLPVASDVDSVCSRRSSISIGATGMQSPPRSDGRMRNSPPAPGIPGLFYRRRRRHKNCDQPVRSAVVHVVCVRPLHCLKSRRWTGKGARRRMEGTHDHHRETNMLRVVRICLVHRSAYVARAQRPEQRGFDDGCPRYHTKTRWSSTAIYQTVSNSWEFWYVPA